MLIDRSIHRIRAYAEFRQWSAEKYAASAGLPASTARDVLKGRGNPTAETLRAMERIVPEDFALSGAGKGESTPTTGEEAA